MLSMEIWCPSTGGHEDARTTWEDTRSRPIDIHVLTETVGEGAGFLRKCEYAWRHSNADMIAYFHSDLAIHEHGWDQRVLAEFEDPSVAVVGFVGATGLGHENIFKTPYAYTQLARYDVWGNLTDAEAHGNRDAGSRNVAVVDSCAVCVRRSFLASVGGWPVERYPNTSHCSDLWICCAARRAGMRVRMVGIGCTHASGGKGAQGVAWLDERGGDVALHRGAHRVTYDEFRDVLPIRVTG